MDSALQKYQPDLGFGTRDGIAWPRGTALLYGKAGRVPQAPPHRLPPGGQDGRCLGCVPVPFPGPFHPSKLAMRSV